MNVKGFTLIELAIIVMIIGILAVIAIPNFCRVTSQAKEAAIKENCHTIQIAAEDFAIQNNGLYAGDVDADITPAGSTLIDLLPSGARLVNPFTQAASEPTDGAVTNPGEIGYAPVKLNRINIGYTITAIGRKPNATIFALMSGQ
jgi:prepilin-type N-terminal cleavage/methylation domain-containing protein